MKTKGILLGGFISCCIIISGIFITYAQNGNMQKYSIEQAISDKAQLNTLAFDALGFITGNTCSDSFLPPGKVADFFGFQYLRDTTQSGKGHSTDFVTNVANNVLYILNSEQKEKMLSLAKTQTSIVNQYALKRFPLMIAFRKQLENNVPSSSLGLNKNATIQYTKELYAIDSTISIARAKLFAEIINSLNDEQKSYLNEMVKGGFASWKALPDQLDKKSLTHDEDVLMMTYASEMFAWFAGDINVDTYFCPERQADYFGGFYLKDAPAMGNAGYTISEAITGDKGEAFIQSLNEEQKQIITSIVDTQRNALRSIVEKRKAISVEFRKALNSTEIDEEKVQTLDKEYGALDGEIAYYYTTAFSHVNKTLTQEQKIKLNELRGLSNYVCPDEKVYLYSEKIDIPTGINTDILFFEPKNGINLIDNIGNITNAKSQVNENGKKQGYLSQSTINLFTQKLKTIPKSNYKKIMDKIDTMISSSNNDIIIGKLKELKRIVQNFIDNLN